MKEIKDYLHFYLGCDMLIVKGLVEPFMYKLTFSRYADALFDNDKPILRPLSSMTDDDRIELHDILSAGGEYDFSKYSDRYKSNFASLHLCDGAYKPIVFTWLLSKHFDIFGLIDAGLAIDATALKQSA